MSPAFLPTPGLCGLWDSAGAHVAEILRGFHGIFAENQLHNTQRSCARSLFIKDLKKNYIPKSVEMSSRLCVEEGIQKCHLYFPVCVRAAQQLTPCSGGGEWMSPKALLLLPGPCLAEELKSWESLGCEISVLILTHGKSSP